MNTKGLLLSGLLFLICGGSVMSQIEAGKAIQITVKGVPAEEKAKIDAVYPVSDRGMLNLPYIGQIKAAGRTPEQLAADIEKAYVDGGIYKTATFEVISGSACGPDVAQVHLGGQLRRPGPIEFEDGMTLWKAIQAAGGATEFGSLKRVKLYRDGEMKSYDMTKKENLEIPLEKNDSIEVPQKSIGCL